MLRLIRQDLIFNRNNLLVILAIMTAVFSYFVGSGSLTNARAYILMSALYIGGSLSITLVAREEKFKIGVLTCSLPVRRSTVIAARFILTWALMLMTLAYSIALAALLPFSRVDISAALNIKFLLVGILILSAVYSLMLPFVIRFGVMGVMLFLAAAQILGIITLLLFKFLRTGIAALASPLTSAIRGLKFLLGPNSTAAHMLLVAVAVLALNAAGFFAGRALYARRDL